RPGACPPGGAGRRARGCCRRPRCLCRAPRPVRRRCCRRCPAPGCAVCHGDRARRCGRPAPGSRRLRPAGPVHQLPRLHRQPVCAHHHGARSPRRGDGGRRPCACRGCPRRSRRSRMDAREPL
ncbi:hypothetical protein IWQ56_004379, partial [Coemansia nantahalensis]